MTATRFNLLQAQQHRVGIVTPPADLCGAWPLLRSLGQPASDSLAAVAPALGDLLTREGP